MLFKVVVLVGVEATAAAAVSVQITVPGWNISIKHARQSNMTLFASARVTNRQQIVWSYFQQLF